MKKAKVTVIIFLFLLTISIYPQFVKGVECNLYSLETDKDTYYPSESITISADWELNYNPATEFAHVQVQIFNIFNILIWNSSEYDMIGTYEKNWTLFIEELALDLTNYSTTIYIKFFYYYFDEFIGIPQGEFLAIIEITIIKKMVSCDLTNFKDSIDPQENLIFEARFYDTLNYSNLVGKNITFTTKVDNMTFYQDSYLTNNSGMIHLNLTVYEELSLGHNYLIFELKDDYIYNNSIFIYEVIVGKIPVYTDIMQFKDEVEYSEEIEIILYYYDSYSNSLQNETIRVSLYGGAELLFENDTKTNELGILSMNFSLESYNKYQEYELYFVFNGTASLENSTLIFNISIIQNPVNQKTPDIYLILPVSISIVIVAVISIIFYLRKKKKPKSLADITFNR